MSDSERPLQELTYDAAGERLRSTCRIAGIALLASPLLPFEEANNQPIFVWDILGELHPATVVAALSPMLVGAALLLAALRLKKPSLLCFVTLLALITWALVAKLGADADARDLAALPASLNRRAELATISVALSGAALRLLAEPAARRAARVVSVLAVISGLAFGLWPSRGEAPVQTFLRFVVAIVELPDFRLVLGYGLILVIVFWPLLAAGTALTVVLAGMQRPAALLAEIVTLGGPGLLALLGLRNVLLTFGDTSVVALLGFAAVLAAVLSLGARSLEQAALFGTGLWRSSDREQGSSRRTLLLATALGGGVVMLVFALSRPTAKGVDWPLAKRSDQAERLFGELLPKWALSRALWSLSAEHAASAAELAEARAAGNQVLQAARAVDAELGRAITELVAESSELDLAGRRWFRLVESVNDASRRTKQPYYLDPYVRTRRQGRELTRLFLVYPYRIERVRPIEASGTTYALLDVRRLGEVRDGHERLGFSRDVQPFALVVLDEIEPYAKSLAEWSRQEPPRCTEHDQPFAGCGDLLRQLSPDAEALRKVVARHELQHQIDGPGLEVSPEVLKALEGYDAAAVNQVNRELSAYLAEFMTEGVSPKLALIDALQLRGSRRGSALHFIGELELAALCKRGRLADREAFGDDHGAMFTELATLSDTDLRARAAEAYEELFDAELESYPSQR